MVDPNSVVIQCPECGLKMSFRPVPNFREKTVHCPKCNHSDKVLNFRILENHSHQNSDTDQQKDEVTELLRKGQEREVSQVEVKCLETGESQILRLGENTLGRKTEESRADITFTDAKAYISRLHASLTLNNTPSGFQLHLLDLGSVNGTFVQGKRLPHGSAIAILPDEPFRMGKLTFVCSIIS